MNELRLLCAGLLAASVGLSLTGCKCVCPENKQSGVAVIVCQPADTAVLPNQPAEFEVRAKGNELAYQWYFNHRPVGDSTTGGQTSRLVIPNVTPDQLGFYSCEIKSISPIWGTPAQIHTRMASLGTSTGQTLMSGSTTNIPPTQVPFTSGTPSGSNPCGSTTNYCGYAIFNNGGLTFTAPAGVTKVCITMSTSAGTVPNTNFDAMRAAGFSDRVCGTNKAGSTTEKCFPVVPGKKYVFTVYFKVGNCPPPGTVVTLTGVWVP